jgi:hypothetical protein
MRLPGRYPPHGFHPSRKGGIWYIVRRAPYQPHSARQACLLGYQQGNAGIGQGTVKALPISQLCDFVSHNNVELTGPRCLRVRAECSGALLNDWLCMLYQVFMSAFFTNNCSFSLTFIYNSYLFFKVFNYYKISHCCVTFCDNRNLNFF